MNFNPEHFNSFWLIVGALVYSGILFTAIRYAQWWRLKDGHDLNVLLYSILAVFLLWLMNTDIKIGEAVSRPTLHLLGATLLTLMFGWAFAVLAISLVIIVFTLLVAPAINDSLFSLPWNILITGVLPASLSYVIFRLVDHYLPNNYFIYIFLAAFLNAALALASVILMSATVHAISGTFSLQTLGDNYIPYGLILMFPEAFITGMMMSIFVVYRPQWVSTFDDSRYLRNR